MRDGNSSPIQTRPQWLEGVCVNLYTTPGTTLNDQIAVFKPNVREKSKRGLRLIAVACVSFE